MKFLEAHLTLNKVTIILWTTENESRFRKLQADKKLYASFGRRLFVRQKQVTYLHGGKISNHLHHFTTHSTWPALYSICPELSLVAFHIISTSNPHSSETDKIPHLLWHYSCQHNDLALKIFFILFATVFHVPQLSVNWTLTSKDDRSQHAVWCWETWSHIELSAKNMRNRGHLKSWSFAEYIGHLNPATKVKHARCRLSFPF
jgi:hypothetical protein